ncbi:MAG: DsrE/DsrF/DrsH-like family protein [Bacteroides sp.]|nr:DsrE/DsrF/DrsH-like family protein [Bacteroides sp.]
MKQASIPYLSSYTHGKSHAGYYPGAKDLSIKITFSPDNGRLLGAQVVGYGGVDKRIDLFAQVIRNNGTIYDLMEIEHAYAPPYASAKDPVNMAGYIAENILTGKMKIVHWRDINPEDTTTLVVDMRTPNEFAIGTLPHAINLPLDKLRDCLSELPKEKRIILTCAVGLRWYFVYRILVQRGFTQIYNLSGGYRTWRDVTHQEACSISPALPDADITSKGSLSAHTAIEVDACGLQCPGSIVQLKKEYAKLQAGGQLLIKATDPVFARDISSWCNMAGAQLIGVDQENGIVEARIYKPGVDTSEPCCSTLSAASSTGQTIIVFSNDLDKAMAAFILANGAAAAGKKVGLFFTFWGLTILKRREKRAVKKDALSRMFGIMLPEHSGKLGLSQLNMAGMGSWFMRKVMKQKNIYSLETLIRQAQENGVQMIACTMSMEVMGIQEEELIDGVELGGVATYLE